MANALHCVTGSQLRLGFCPLVDMWHYAEAVLVVKTEGLGMGHADKLGIC